MKPDSYINQLRLGYVYCLKADAAQNELSKQTFTSYEESTKAQDAVDAIYGASIPSLEKAHELAPTELTPVELLKSVYYRFSYDDADMKAKFDHFNNLYKEMNQQ